MSLRFHRVSKAFGRSRVLQGASHSFAPGLYALHGPNGIGKSTLLAILAGILDPDEGEVHIDGHSLQSDPVAAKARLSYVPDECPLYPFMTGRELLQFIAGAKCTVIGPEVEILVDRFRLRPYLDTRFGHMSLGTQKKTRPAVASFDMQASSPSGSSRIPPTTPSSSLWKTRPAWSKPSSGADFVNASASKSFMLA